MGKMQRNKGSAFEREIANALGVKRNIGQSRDGGNDLDFPPYTIECKRYGNTVFRWEWMHQAIAACTPERPTPVVVSRVDRGEALVVMRFTDWLALVTSPASSSAPSSPDASSVPSGGTPAD